MLLPFAPRSPPSLLHASMSQHIDPPYLHHFSGIWRAVPPTGDSPLFAPPVRGRAAQDQLICAPSPGFGIDSDRRFAACSPASGVGFPVVCNCHIVKYSHCPITHARALFTSLPCMPLVSHCVLLLCVPLTSTLSLASQLLRAHCSRERVGAHVRQNNVARRRFGLGR